MSCRWKDVQAGEDCSRDAKVGFEFCEEHVNALVAIGREKTKSIKGRLPLPYVDKFLAAIVGAAGTAVVEHWDSIYALLCHLSRIDALAPGMWAGYPGPPTPEAVAETFRLEPRAQIRQYERELKAAGLWKGKN